MIRIFSWNKETLGEQIQWRKKWGWVGGGVRRPPPLFCGASLIHFLYKVLGKRSVHEEPFWKISFSSRSPLKNSFLRRWDAPKYICLPFIFRKENRLGIKTDNILGQYSSLIHKIIYNFLIRGLVELYYCASNINREIEVQNILRSWIIFINLLTNSIWNVNLASNMYFLDNGCRYFLFPKTSAEYSRKMIEFCICPLSQWWQLSHR